jgi:hypothetical protein
VKSVEGSVIETHGNIETKILEGPLQIPFRFQLVSKQVDLLGDRMLGRDFLKQMQAKVCYQSRTQTFTYAGVTINKQMINDFSGNKGFFLSRKFYNLCTNNAPNTRMTSVYTPALDAKKIICSHRYKAAAHERGRGVSAGILKLVKIISSPFISLYFIVGIKMPISL